jgi:hypothetical protein
VCCQSRHTRTEDEENTAKGWTAGLRATQAAKKKEKRNDNSNAVSWEREHPITRLDQYLVTPTNLLNDSLSKCIAGSFTNQQG